MVMLFMCWLRLKQTSTRGQRWENILWSCVILKLFKSLLYFVSQYFCPHILFFFFFLLTHYASCSVCLCTSSIQSICKLTPSFCVCTQNGCTAIYMACEKDHVAVAQVLLQKHADVSICREVWSLGCSIELHCLAGVVYAYVLCLHRSMYSTCVLILM